MQSYLLSGMGDESLSTRGQEPGRSGIWMRAIALTRNQNSVADASHDDHERA